MTPSMQRVLEKAAPRSTSERYGLALLLTIVAFLVMLGLLAVSDEPMYAPLVGAVAVAAWFGGVGPATTSSRRRMAARVLAARRLASTASSSGIPRT